MDVAALCEAGVNSHGVAPNVPGFTWFSSDCGAHCAENGTTSLTGFLVSDALRGSVRILQPLCSPRIAWLEVPWPGGGSAAIAACYGPAADEAGYLNFTAQLQANVEQLCSSSDVTVLLCGDFNNNNNNMYF